MKKARAAILATYDGSDGALDGIIADQRNIASFDTGILSKIGFSPAQIDTFELIRRPYTYSGKGLIGSVTNPGFPITDVGGWSSFLLGSSPPPWPGSDTVTPAEMARRGAPFIHTMADTNTRAQRPGGDYWSVANLSELVRLATRDGQDMPLKDPMDFSALAQSKAKMIVYHGVNDQAMGYLETIAGRDLLAKRFPDADNWLRAFAVPGLLHCRGGDGPTDIDERLLEALIDWVEKGQAPVSVVTNRSLPGKPTERRFLLCAEPTRARLVSPGLDPAKAESWQCR
jgi:feruloyl esterase